MHEKFWKNEYIIDGVSFTLNDIKKIEFNLENYKCYLVFSEKFKAEVAYEVAQTALNSNKFWRPIDF